MAGNLERLSVHRSEDRLPAGTPASGAKEPAAARARRKDGIPMPRIRRSPGPRTIWPLLAILVASIAPSASAQLMIKSSDESAFVKFGVLVQPWADWSQNATGGYSQNLFLRRFRLLVGGQIMPGLTFFAETDDPNLGKSVAGTKTISSGFIVQDAYVEYKKTNAIFLDAGLMLVPFCRNCLNSAATLMAIDYGTYSFVESAATQSVVGRDTGFQLRGYVLGDRLEYRAAALQGERNELSSNAFRFTGRVQYNFLDPEVVAFFYPGTTFGKKKTLAIGAAYDTQKDYQAWDGDVYFDYPVGSNAVTAEADYIQYDGGATFTTIAKQDDLSAQAGFFFSPVKLLPYFRYETRRFSHGTTPSKDEQRYQIGLGWYLKGHNANVKLAYTKVDPDSGRHTDQFTVQLQGFYF